MSHEKYLAKHTINRRENEFIDEARSAGLDVYQSPAIPCPYPVENKYGEITKVKTVPDCIVIDEKLAAYFYVEVTNGGASTSHKKAQMRVVEAAGIQNYAVITSTEIEYLKLLSEPQQKLGYLRYLFGWDDLQ